MTISKDSKASICKDTAIAKAETLPTESSGATFHVYLREKVNECTRWT
jgi:hypothetical protein